MPLTDLVRHLNQHRRHVDDGLASRAPFIAEAGQVFVDFAGIRLHSLFLPVIDTHSGKVHGHAAQLRPIGLSTGTPLPAEAVFVLPSDNHEFVQLDRLVRTLHALNYLTHAMRGNLLLPVHKRHVLSVPSDHGLAFEEILRPCGLIPEQITLEIDFDWKHAEHLARAVRNYQHRGYSLALRLERYDRADESLLRQLRPNIIRLHQLPGGNNGGHSVHWGPLFPLARELGSRILVDNWLAADQPLDTDLPHIDLIQARQESPPLLDHAA